MAVFNIQHTGVSRFQYTAFKNHTELSVPDLPTQQKIAAILSAYDELIENNKRRIALLEKMAEEIYREWFVRLRFPGHEKVKFVKGVPNGWEVRPFSQIVNINPSERIDKSEERPFVGMEDLSLTSMFFTSKETRKGGSGSKFRNYDVLFPRITPSVENGKRGFVMTLADGQFGLGSTEFIVMREKVIGPEHIYFLTCSSDFRKHAELSMTGASGWQRVQEKCFSFFLVKTPPSEVRRQFSEIVRPHFSQIHLLSRQTDHLVKSRDLLLPRLMSGKLSVENLDIQFPPGMAEEAASA
jgi:type I restriction enzyme S subunit